MALLDPSEFLTERNVHLQTLRVPDKSLMRVPNGWLRRIIEVSYVWKGGRKGISKGGKKEGVEVKNEREEKVKKRKAI